MATEKSMFPLRLANETMDMVKITYPKDNCASINEFIEKAVKFYISYLTTNKETSFLNPMLYAAIKASLKESENRQADNMFRLAVEMSVLMNIIAGSIDIDEDKVNRIRSRCRKEVVKSKGGISFNQALKYQKSDD